MEKSQIQEILKSRRILSANGTVKPGKQPAFDRVQKLVKLHPNDPAWVEGVVTTAFTPNTQNTSFIDVAQERGVVDGDYIPIDEEEYEMLVERWDDSIYSPFPRKKVEEAFQSDGPEREQMKFFNDDSECW